MVTSLLQVLWLLCGLASVVFAAAVGASKIKLGLAGAAFVAAGVWVERAGTPDPQQRGSHFLSLVGRLKSGVSESQAQQEIDRHVLESEARVGKNHPC